MTRSKSKISAAPFGEACRWRRLEELVHGFEKTNISQARLFDSCMMVDLLRSIGIWCSNQTKYFSRNRCQRVSSDPFNALRARSSSYSATMTVPARAVLRYDISTLPPVPPPPPPLPNPPTHPSPVPGRLLVPPTSFPATPQTIPVLSSGKPLRSSVIGTSTSSMFPNRTLSPRPVPSSLAKFASSRCSNSKLAGSVSVKVKLRKRGRGDAIKQRRMPRWSRSAEGDAGAPKSDPECEERVGK